MTRMLALVLFAVSGVLLAGCGGSSKPSYCSAVSSLESSIKAVPSTNIVKNGTSALASAFSKVQSDATAVVSAAKSDFPNETSALTSSVNALSRTVKQVASSPTAATIVQLPAEVSALSSAAKNFSSATASKCG